MKEIQKTLEVCLDNIKEVQIMNEVKEEMKDKKEKEVKEEMKGKDVYFHNCTDLPIMINSFVDGSSQLFCRKVEPKEKVLVHSSVGKWYLDSMFPLLSDIKKWREKGLEKCVLVGEFQTQACFSGERVWMEQDAFRCIYSPGLEGDYETMSLYSTDDAGYDIMHTYF